MTGIANIGKVSEYQFHTCNTANFFTSQKSKRVNLPISAVLVLSTTGWPKTNGCLVHHSSHKTVWVCQNYVQKHLKKS